MKQVLFLFTALLLCAGGSCGEAVSTINAEWDDDVSSTGYVTIQFQVKYDTGLTDPIISFDVQEGDDGTAAAVLLRAEYNATTGTTCSAERSGSVLEFNCGSDPVQELKVREGSGSWQTVTESGVTLPCGLTVKARSVSM